MVDDQSSGLDEPHTSTPPEKEARPSFWTSLPGVLTGLATLITAIAAVFGVIATRSSNDAGDDSSEEFVVSDTLAAWIGEANEICESIADEAQTNATRLAQATTQQQIVSLLREKEALETKYVKAMKALDAPDEYEAEIARLHTLSDSSLAFLQGARSAMTSGDTQTYVVMVERFNSTTERVNEIFRQIGAASCDFTAAS
jgi:hypothetical protein